MTIDEKAETLSRFAWSLDGFVVLERLSETPDHLGAIVVDAVLQAGINYKTVVRPRVERLRDEYPEARTTSGFLALIDRVCLSDLIEWKGQTKLSTIAEVLNLLKQEQVETRSQLKLWLLQFGSTSRLTQIKGIGEMTADYLKMLAGIEVCAADSLTMGFMRQAGIEPKSYDEARDILCRASRMMDVHPVALGFSIWEYMAKQPNS
ncbi:hypothetical protein J7M28_09755 [bacterium]|nr:hypothetical protein [bacterium]